MKNTTRTVKSIGTGVRKEACVVDNLEKFTPLPHQEAVKNYFLRSPHRGLLLYHLLGSGKTCASIIIAEEMIKRNLIERVFVCTTGSLRKNFTYEYCTLCGIKNNLKKYYTFITYNTHIFETLKRIDFNNSLVIIDEAHNLINGAKNITLNPYSLYNQILNSNARVLILSGTVIYDKIYEWVILGNLLKKDTFPNIIETGHLRKELFDNNIEEIFSKESLEGIISYFPGITEDYPEVITHDPIIVPMTAEQANSYDTLKKIEVMMIVKGPPKPADYRINPINAHYNHVLYILATKHIFTRAISNVNYGGINRVKITKEERKEIYTTLPFPLKKASTIRYEFEKNKPEPKTIEMIVLNAFNIIAPTCKDIININDENLPEIIKKIIDKLILSKFISYDEIKPEEIENIVKNEIEKIKNIEKIDRETDELFEDAILTDDNDTLDEQKEEFLDNNMNNMYDMCNLCENSFLGANNLIYQLPCGDIFHFECLKIYLKHNAKICPTCKKPFYGDIEKKYAKKYSYINIPDTLRKADGTGGWVSHDILKNKKLESISPKILTLILNILKNFDSKHVVFSFFLEKSGIRLIHTLLELCNIKSIIYHGDLKPETKENLIKLFNKKSNMYGNQYKVFLSTEAGFEGITLKDVGHVHFLETNPLPNKTLQAIGRAVRYKSHENLPPEKKVVNIWKYYSAPILYVGDNKDFNTTNSDLNTFDDYYDYYVKNNFRKYLIDKYGKDTINYRVGGIDEKLAVQHEYKLEEFKKFYDILKLNSIELQGQINTYNPLEDFLDQIITQNILYLCANNKTAEMEVPKGQQFIEEYIKNSHKNYYIGLDLEDDLAKNKCRLEFGYDNLEDVCKFNVLFDIIVLEFCPIGFHKTFFTDKFFDDINRILKDDGIIVVPNSFGERLADERNKKTIIYFEENMFELINISEINDYSVYYFKKNLNNSQDIKILKEGQLIDENTIIPETYSGLIEEENYEPFESLEQNIEELIEKEGAEETKERDYEEEEGAEETKERDYEEEEGGEETKERDYEEEIDYREEENLFQPLITKYYLNSGFLDIIFNILLVCHGVRPSYLFEEANFFDTGNLEEAKELLQTLIKNINENTFLQLKTTNDGNKYNRIFVYLSESSRIKVNKDIYPVDLNILNNSKAVNDDIEIAKMLGFLCVGHSYFNNKYSNRIAVSFYLKKNGDEDTKKIQFRVEVCDAEKFEISKTENEKQIIMFQNNVNNVVEKYNYTCFYKIENIYSTRFKVYKLKIKDLEFIKKNLETEYINDLVNYYVADQEEFKRTTTYKKFIDIENTMKNILEYTKLVDIYISAVMDEEFIDMYFQAGSTIDEQKEVAKYIADMDKLIWE